MAAPAWFDAKAYFNNKLASMGSGWDSLSLQKAFEEAGYRVDFANGDSLYSHFEQFGNDENISPNSLFVQDEYLYSKAVDYYGTSSVTTNQIESMLRLMNESGMSAWDHYLKYGFGEGINPSQAFDSNAYMESKLAQLQSTEPAEGWTMDKLTKVFEDLGLTALTHYYAYGRYEPGVEYKPSIIGGTFDLSTGDDTLYGTSGNDYFMARPGTLGDRDYIDGLGGNDTLYAYVDWSDGATTPVISNVENIIFRAQHGNSDDNSNNLVPPVHIDAGDISGMTYLGNDNSRAQLNVEDVRTNSNSMTIAWSDGDPGQDVGYGVYFNPQNLKTEDASTAGTLNLQIMDVFNADTNNQPLLDNPFDQFKFAYINESGTYEVITLVLRGNFKGSTATYDSLLEAFENAISDLEGQRPDLAGRFTVRKGNTFTADAAVNGEMYSSVGENIVLESPRGAISADPQLYPETGWAVSSGTVPSGGRIVWDATPTVDAECPLIVTNVELDNVGRVQWGDARSECLPDNAVYGSEAGDLIIGSMANRGGVERMNVKVDRGSWVSSLQSTNDTLRAVVVTNADLNGDGKNGNTTAEANQEGFGQLYVGRQIDYSQYYGQGGANDGNPPLVGQDIAQWTDRSFLLSATTTPAGIPAGLSDVKEFDASGFQGMLNVGAEITDLSFQKYLRDVDGTWSIANQFAPRGDFNYKLGSNHDALNMKVNSGIAADNDFRLNINAGEGNDFVNFWYDGPLSANQMANMKYLRNVVINGEAGNDTVKVWGETNGNAGVIQVNGGGGEDVIFVGQLPDGGAEQNAVWVFNVGDDGAAGWAAANAGNRAINMNAQFGAQSAFNDMLGTVRNVDFNIAGLVAGEQITVTVNFQGITSTVNLYNPTAVERTAGTVTLTTRQINKAIIDAINSDKVLGNVLVAKDGAADSLIVESLIDGLMDTTDLTVAWGTTSTGTVNSTSTAYNTNMASNAAGLADVTGSNVGTVSHNWVNGGAGNDVLVLNVNPGTVDYHDVLILESGFGNDTVFNFDTGVDQINLRALLTNVDANNNLVALNNNYGQLNAALVEGAGPHTGTNTGSFYTAQEFFAQRTTAANLGLTANAKNVVFWQDGTNPNMYTAFHIQDTNGDATLQQSEVTVIGTLTLDDDHGVIANGDFSLTA